MNYTAEHNIYAATPRKSYFEVDTAIVKEPMTFDQISTALDVPLDEIQYFNPQYRKNVIPAGGNILTLPKAKIGTFISNEQDIYAAIKAQQTEMAMASTVVKEVQRTHVVKNGEKLSTIARKYGVTVADIKSWNYIGKKGIRAGKRLVIYVRQDVPQTTPSKPNDTPKDPQGNLANNAKSDSSASTADPKKLADNSAASGKAQYHKVKKGETYYMIAKKYGITVQELLEMNKLNKNSKLLMGQQLKVKLVS